MKKKTNNQKDVNGVLIPGGLLLGIGLGFLFGNIPAWTLIGLGGGFIAMYLTSKK